ncbi:hypothetical protein A2397_02570 [Candidatus Amesbacteria bacterium RIFOXYB1_FULL_44_23]|uniref:Baseplate protein J-like domain-containing protein n=1 Tax=Candidatus Amesbacteria bacterium RIFOXYB1_FULL_44_23 TaxID=1797263 RepID=A0A1F4ZUV0_9BACT|nr:MAG: hypothetical protein A2397_02570 [Candidatus Amesbacteria bacterium RIFOXYB1_FULL_44_23]
MNLPFLQRQQSSQTRQREYLFALDLAYDHVASAIWTVANGKTQVISLGKIALWQESTAGSLLEACDQTLSDSTFQVDRSGRVQPDKIILGLPNDWIVDEKINPDKLKILKQVTKELSLTAVGFVVTPQAIVRYLYHTEGVPPTAIIVGISKSLLEVTLSRLGKIQSTQIVKRSSNLVSDLTEGVSRFLPQDMLPSRILLYNSGSSLEETKQILLGHPWQAPQTKLPFLHFPKIEILPPDFPVKAISLSGGSEVAQAIGLLPAQPTTSNQIEDVDDDTTDLGFFRNIDIAKQEPVLVEEPIEEKLISSPKSHLPSFSRLKFNFHLPAFKIQPPKFMGLIASVMALALCGIYFYWYFPTAEIQITLAPKEINTQFEAEADAGVSKLDLDAKILPATYIETEASGQKSRPSTGSKIIGDKATGEALILNGTSSPRSFPAGTVITSPSGLKFVLDASVEVASASGTADPNSYQPGRSKVGITAAAIGSEYNLSAGTQFRVGSFSFLDFVAKNEAALSGGSSRLVQVVSDKDMSLLKAELTSLVKEEVVTKLKNQVSENKNIIESSISLSTLLEKFSHDQGEVVDSISLDLTLKAAALSFSTQDIDQLVTQSLTSLIPSGFQQDKETNRAIQVKSLKGQKAQISVQVASRLIPILNTDQINTDISGKSQSYAKDYIGKLPNVSGSKIQIKSILPESLVGLPHISKNITITTNVSE